MTEMQQAMNTLKHLAANQVIQFPSGRWGFVGRVDARLCYEKKDGTIPTDKELSDAAQFGPGLLGLKTRAFETKELALEALNNLS